MEDYREAGNFSMSFCDAAFLKAAECETEWHSPGRQIQIIRGRDKGKTFANSRHNEPNGRPRRMPRRHTRDGSRAFRNRQRHASLKRHVMLHPMKWNVQNGDSIMKRIHFPLLASTPSLWKLEKNCTASNRDFESSALEAKRTSSRKNQKKSQSNFRRETQNRDFRFFPFFVRQATAAPSTTSPAETAAAEAAGSGGPSAVPSSGSGGSGEVWSVLRCFGRVTFDKLFLCGVFMPVLCCRCLSIYDACPFRWCHFDFSQTLPCVTNHGANLSLQVPTSRRISGNRSTMLENLGRVHLWHGDSLCYIHSMPSQSLSLKSNCIWSDG